MHMQMQRNATSNDIPGKAILFFLFDFTIKGLQLKDWQGVSQKMCNNHVHIKAKSVSPTANH